MNNKDDGKVVIDLTHKNIKDIVPQIMADIQYGNCGKDILSKVQQIMYIFVEKIEKLRNQRAKLK